MAGPIAFLGREDSPVLAHLRAVEDDLVTVGPSEPFEPGDARFAVSHGYRLILRAQVLEQLPIVNPTSPTCPTTAAPIPRSGACSRTRPRA